MLPDVVAAGPVADAAGELLAPLGAVPLAGAVAEPVVVADGDGDGLCEAEPPLIEIDRLTNCSMCHR